MRATLDACRWLYNHLLEQRKTAYEERGETLTPYHAAGDVRCAQDGAPHVS